MGRIECADGIQYMGLPFVTSIPNSSGTQSDIFPWASLGSFAEGERPTGPGMAGTCALFL